MSLFQLIRINPRIELNIAIPQRYPSCVVFGKGQSMQCGGVSCAARTGIRSCHFGIGRSCCHHGRRACPVNPCNQHSIPLRIHFSMHSSLRCCPRPFNRASPPRPRRKLWGIVPFQGRSSRRRRYRRRYGRPRMYPPTVLLSIRIVDSSHVKIANSPVWAESAIRLF